jgi:uncharacterized lipoprotein YmbA
LKAIDRQQVNDKFNLPPSLIIGIGPIKVPEYQNRPQIVTQDENGLLTFAQFDRWGESLDLALLHLLAANFAVMLPKCSIALSPWNFSIPVKYQVIMEIVRMESRLDKDISLIVQWSIIDLEKKKMALTKRSEFRQPVNPHNYSGLAEALSVACASLSVEITEALISLANKPETK